MSRTVVALLYAHEHIPDISPENTPVGIWWDAANESYACRKNDPNFRTTYWKYQYQIGGFKLDGRTWLAQVGEGRTGERVFLLKRNGQLLFVELKAMAFEDDDAQYFHIEFLRNEFDGEFLSFEAESYSVRASLCDARTSSGSEASSDDSEPSEQQHSTSELEAAVALMQLRAMPFLLDNNE